MEAPVEGVEEKKRATVFVVADSGHEYSKAADRGNIVFLYEDKVNVFASDKLVKEIEEKLANSEPGDFLILSGNQLAAAIAFDVMLNKHGQVNVLIYSFKFQLYELRTIQATQFKDWQAAK